MVTEVAPRGFWDFQQFWVHLFFGWGVPYNKDSTVLESGLGSPYLGNLPFGGTLVHWFGLEASGLRGGGCRVWGFRVGVTLVLSQRTAARNPPCRDLISTSEGVWGLRF